MTDNFDQGRAICLFDANAECSQIWISEADGLYLGHFQSFRQEPTLEERKAVPVTTLEHVSNAVAYEKCVRKCLPGGGHF